MKKSRLLKLLLILLLIGIIFFPWGDGEKKEEVSPPPSVKSSGSARHEGAPSEDLIWGDVPIYPGAKRIREEMTIPLLEAVRADYKKVEHRCYQTADDGEKVASFYETEMPKRGWKKVMSMDFEGESFLASWQRRSEGIGVTIMTLERKENGKLGLVMVRGHQRK